MQGTLAIWIVTVSSLSIVRDAVKDEGVPRKPLGSRLRERFAGIGLEDELAELPREVARPGVFRL